MTNTNNKKPGRRMARESKLDLGATPPKPDAPRSEQNDEPAPAKVPSKTDTVLSLLTRAEGAALNELVAATGWLPHTTRAAMTGLKKKGHQIERNKIDGISRYAIVHTATQ